MFLPGVMLAAWVIEVLFGWPNWLYRSIRHPVVWMGWGASHLERQFNRRHWAHAARYFTGAINGLLIISMIVTGAFLVQQLLPNTIGGFALEAVIASSLIASRSLFTHIRAVHSPLHAGDIETARCAVAKIVGRNTNEMGQAEIAGASIESLAENASDGVIAPLFWGVIFGLPGLAGYKAINTLDSMFGHKSERFGAYGGFVARLDDIANFIPARLTGVFICMAGLSKTAFAVMRSDAPTHRSPNAGWPESAMAAVLGLRLAGPRQYDGKVRNDPWLNADARDPNVDDIKRGLHFYVLSLGICAVLLLLMFSIWERV